MKKIFAADKKPDGDDIPMFRRNLKFVLAYCLFAAAMIGAVTFASGAYYNIALTAIWLVSFVAAIVFILPSKWTVALTPIPVLSLWWALEKAAKDKINLTNFPLMAADVRMTVANPKGLLLSIGSPKVFYFLLDVLPWVLAVACLYLVLRLFKSYGLRSLAILSLWGVAKLSLIAAGFLLLYTATSTSMTQFIKSNDSEFGVWSGDGLTKFASYIGVIPFVIYSDSIDSDGTRNFLGYQPSASAPPTSDILASVSKYLNLSTLKPRMLPNIILIHAESTFDPNDVFNLEAPVNNEMFYSQPLPEPDSRVHFRGAGLANVIGGGSWVSEFEVINGIDSRLFGIAGRYTHASLSAYSHNSLVTYLSSRGYQTSVSTTANALFYNYGVAYKRYGFQRFHGETGDPNSDVSIVSAALTQDTDFTSGDNPFFKFILLAHNHSPHPCDLSAPEGYGPEKFVAAASESETCALREYVRRARDTERAIGFAKAFLAYKKLTTGRPYVIAVYGDHQPYSFTGDGPVSFNLGMVFDRFRKDTAKRKTIIELISSADNPFLNTFGKPIPLTLLPTLVSSYVATAPDQLYLPENLYQFDRCGSDMIGQLTGGSFYGDKVSSVSGVCKAFDSVVSALKQSDVVSDKPPQETVPASVVPIINPPASGVKCTVKSIKIAAAGSYFEGAPEIAVSIDGKEIGTTKLSDDNSSAKKDLLELVRDPNAPIHEFTIPDNITPNQIAIRFTNDLWDKSGADRNVNIHDVKIDGKPINKANVSFSPPDVGWVNDNGVIQIFGKGAAILNGPFDQGCQ